MKEDKEETKKIEKKIRKRQRGNTEAIGGLPIFICRIYALSKISPRELK
jgi:hypothetical protein